MKGQSALVNEILLFIMGIMIASFVAYAMGNIQHRVENISTSDHIKEMSDYITAAVVKLSASGEDAAILLINKPYYSGKTYRMRFIGGNLVVSLFDDERVNVTREIFNISAGKTIIGDVTSSSRYILMKSNATTIEMKTWKGNWT